MKFSKKFFKNKKKKKKSFLKNKKFHMTMKINGNK